MSMMGVAVLACVGLAALASVLCAAEPGLVGYWPLAGDCRDRSGHGHDGVNHGADLSAVAPDEQKTPAARFDGVDDSIEVAPAEELRFGTGDFSVAVWLHTDGSGADGVGDVLSRFDPLARRGLHLGVLQHAGMTTCQSNRRNVGFGIDNAVGGDTWRDCGRPGRARFICSMAVYEGDLYVGTFEIEPDGRGHVFRYLGGAGWEDCGCPDQSNSVMSLAVHNGQLYAGTARYNSRGSLMGAPGNTTPGGRVLRYAGARRWVDCGKPAGVAVTALTVFQGALYVSDLYARAVFRYESGTRWTQVGDKQRVFAMAPFNGHLYGATSGEDDVWRFAGAGPWTPVGRAPRVTQYYSFAVYQGALHVGTWPEGIVYRLDGERTWTSTGRLRDEKESMALAVYNGKLYTGTLPLAEVFRYDGGAKWTSVGRVDRTPNVTYRRAWTMAVFQGKLFCGVLPSGRVLALEAGKMATDDRELAPGWRHLSAVRRRDRLHLYVDGRQRAQSTPFDPTRFDLDVDRPLTIGAGPHDHLNGHLRELRLYSRALSEQEIAALSSQRP